MRYYISDLHFYHSTMIDVDKRGFDMMEQLHAYMIKQWNSRVTDEDEVVVLGDFSMGNGIQTWNTLARLRGKIILVEGNHDTNYLDDSEFVDNVLEEITNYAEYKDGKNLVIASHYPLMFYNKQFDPNTYMLYGHVHNTFDEYLLHQSIKLSNSQFRKNRKGIVRTTPFQMINTFCLFSDFIPLTLAEWIEIDGYRRQIIDEREKELGHILTYEEWDDLGNVIKDKINALKGA
ncbi:MAG: metallophosphoesterase family protein [Holdemanella sp.]|nr:metallophosphoesterase family protein [Holdemanella sp.]